MMPDLKTQIQTTVTALQRRIKTPPSVALVLGTGLGDVAHHLTSRIEISYRDIPHFPVSTAPGHHGQLVVGQCGGKTVAVMEGRFHAYEGWSLHDVTYPIRVLRALGATTLILSNASGGMNPLFDKGDLMLITDHINFMGINPLIGPNDESLGPRFPDMSEPYDQKLLALARTVAREEKIPLKEGVYIGVTGPNLETRAEYRFMRMIGADAVGMSTVPEVIVGVHAGVKILAVSVITDRCLPDTLVPLTVEEVIAIAQKAAPILTKLILKTIERL